MNRQTPPNNPEPGDDVAAADTAEQPAPVAATEAGDTPEATFPVEKIRWGGRRLADGSRVFWWRELIGVWVFYQVYSWSRGRSTGSETRAWENAHQIIAWEKSLFIYHELTIQKLVMAVRPLIIGLNYFYGLAHFIITIAVIVWIYRRRTNHYPFWRNVFALLCAVALLGYIFYPLMPPRLLDTYPLNWDFQYHFQDALELFPNAWSFTTGPIKHQANPYAAMPSLHFGFSLFSGIAVHRLAKGRVWKNLAIAYPCLMLLAIVATGNHFFLDAVGGAVVLGAAYLVAKRITRGGIVPGRFNPAYAQNDVDLT